MYSRILVAIDGSATADVALTEAVRLARTHCAALRIAHVIEQGGTGAGEQRAGCEASAAKRAGGAILAEAAAFANEAGLRVDVRLLEIEAGQRVVDALAEEARAWPADLVVVGTHGNGPPSRYRLGSVAEGLALEAPEPVLLVPVPPPE